MFRKVLSTAAGGLLVALALGAAVELGVRLSGAGVPTPGAVLNRRAAYLVPEPAAPGVWRTQYWEDVREDLVLRPRPRRTTVMLFGGSNAWSFRDSMLHNALRRAAPGVPFQVVNLGRNGYGSERVRLIFEQALEHLDPDVVVLYFGDNEFVESPLPRSVRELPYELRGVHTARLVAGLLRPVDVAGAPPEPWVPDWDYYAELTYDRTLERLDVLRRNLRAMLARAEQRGTRAVVCSVVYNRFAAPHATRLDGSLSRAERRRFEALRAEALALLPEALDPLLPATKDDRIRRLDWEQGTPDEPEARPDGRRVGMRPLAEPLTGLDASPPTADAWHARVWRLNETLAWLHARSPSDAERERLERAAALLDEALTVAPDHARALFERALVAYLLGADEAEVEARLLAAARYDRAPKKSNEAINGLLREVALEFPETLFVDVDERFAAASPGRLVGWELMFDHCHLLPGARRYAMDVLGEAIAGRWFTDG